LLVENLGGIGFEPLEAREAFTLSLLFYLKFLLSTFMLGGLQVFPK